MFLLKLNLKPKQIITIRMIYFQAFLISFFIISYGETIETFMIKWGYHGLISMITINLTVILFLKIDKNTWKKILLETTIISFILFALAECYQGDFKFIPGSVFDWWDIVAHLAGSIIGYFFSYHLVRKKMFFYF